MENQPYYEKDKKLDRVFPFTAWDSIKPGFWFPLHWHPWVELLIVRKGSIDLVIDGKTQGLNAGDIVLVDSGRIHGFSNPSPQAATRIFHFGMEIFIEALSELREKSVTPLFRRATVIPESSEDLYREMIALLKAIFEEYRSQAPGYRPFIIGKLYELAALLMRRLPAKPLPENAFYRMKRQNKRIESIFSYINENFDDPDLTLEIAAGESGLDRCYFSRLIKAQTGQSFSEHLARVRLHKAEELLLSGTEAITNIAFTCGFNSIATFNRLFRAYTGTTPTAFRGGTA
jgi:AraC-like DNA-binding protein